MNVQSDHDVDSLHLDSLDNFLQIKQCTSWSDCTNVVLFINIVKIDFSGNKYLILAKLVKKSYNFYKKIINYSFDKNSNNKEVKIITQDIFSPRHGTYVYIVWLYEYILCYNNTFTVVILDHVLIFRREDPKPKAIQKEKKRKKQM